MSSFTKSILEGLIQGLQDHDAEHVDVFALLLDELANVAHQCEYDGENHIRAAAMVCGGQEDQNAIEILEPMITAVCNYPDLWFALIESLQGVCEYKAAHLTEDEIGTGEADRYMRIRYAMDAAYRVCTDSLDDVDEYNTCGLVDDWCSDVAKAICSLDGIRPHVRPKPDESSALVHVKHIARMIRMGRNHHEGDSPAALLLLNELITAVETQSPAREVSQWMPRGRAIIKAAKEKGTLDKADYILGDKKTIPSVEGMEQEWNACHPNAGERYETTTGPVCDLCRSVHAMGSHCPN